MGWYRLRWSVWGKVGGGVGSFILYINFVGKAVVRFCGD